MQRVKTQTVAFASLPLTTATLNSIARRSESKSPTTNYFIPSTNEKYMSTHVLMVYSVKSLLQWFSYMSSSEISMQIFSEATVLSTFTKTSKHDFTAISPTKTISKSSASSFGKATNVIALSTVAGVAAASAVGTGVNVLTSKRCNSVGN